MDKSLYRSLLPSMLIMLGFFPLMYVHALGMLQKPHYQFLFLMPIAVWMMVTSVAKEVNPAGESRGMNLAWPFLILGFLGLASATWGWSPWVAAVSAQVCALAVVLSTGGWKSLRRWYPVWVFTWILVPLPLGLDQDLIVRSREYTTTLSSAMLDQLGVFHQRSANVIELPAKKLFIADACSGVHSLYVLMAVALFWVLWMRRSLVHTLFLLLSTFGIVLIENVLRIVIVAVLIGYKRDLSEGIPHTVLGGVLFCASVILVASMDQLITFLLPDMPKILMRWAERRQKARKSSGTSPTPSINTFSKAWVVCCCCFPLLGVAQFFRMPSEVPRLSKFFESGFDLPRLEATALPEEINGFRRYDYRTVERVFGDPFGQASQQWYYKKGDVTAIISLDYPYDGLHDLCLCYRQVGWAIPEREVLSGKRLSEEWNAPSEDPLAMVSLGRELGEVALLLFSLDDKDGRTAVLLKEESGSGRQRASRRITSIGEGVEPERTEVPFNPPFVQTQLIASSYKPISPAMKREVLQVFVTARRQLKSRIVDSQEAGKSSAGQ